ncbi:MAG: FMN reductase, partial [Methyloprofundus sp.]|nr:FMN reductase [Methyloprofundus sp.]
SRKESFNQKLVKIAASGASQQGASLTIINLADFPMPIFNQDLEQEQGMPESARQLKQLMIEHDGFLIASPEYNSAFTPLLKNTLDWVSRAESDDEPPLAAYHGKIAAIMATSPGPLGGLRGLVFLRMLLANMGVIVLPDQRAIPKTFKAFNDKGLLLDDAQQSSILSLGSQLAISIDKLNR